MNAPAVARRCCLCLDCRTALMAGDTCDCSSTSRVACFEERDEREKIVEACWGSLADREHARRLSQRAQRRVLATSMGSFSLGGTVAYGLAGLGPGVLVWGMLGSLTGGILARHKGMRERLQPQGAATDNFDDKLSLRGTVTGSHALLSPAGAQQCLAYSVELRVLTSQGERVMYRDAVTSGFTVALGTGEHVRIPAGRLRFAGEAPEILDVDNLELEAYLDEVDPERGASEELHPLHFNLVREDVLFQGDQVELGGEFVRESDRAEPAALYRDRVNSHLRLISLPIVRRVR